jgi:SAM-dependent methyltransferase
LRKGRALRWEDYDRLWITEFGARPANETEYFRLHKLRYYELFDTVIEHLNGRLAPRVLDVGTGEFLPLYKQLLPQMELVTLDRPTEQNGFAPGYALHRARARQHYSVDLNQVRLTTTHGTPPLGLFDYILFTEVLEHLLVHPIELLEDLLSLLKPDGYLYLTTPNFFSHRRVAALARGENPQEVYPRRGQNWDAHYHYREYTLPELVRFTAEAGGQVIRSGYSACWDEPEVLAGICPEERLSQLVLLIAPGAGSH